MSSPDEARKKEMERIIHEGLEEDLLRCTQCGDPECLGLCENPPDFVVGASPQPSQFWLTDEGYYPPGR